MEKRKHDGGITSQNSVMWPTRDSRKSRQGLGPQRPKWIAPGRIEQAYKI